MINLQRNLITLKPYFKRALLWAAYGLIILAIVSRIFRALTPMASRYKPKLEHLLSVLSGQTVTIENLETGWYWFQPVIKAKKVLVNGEEHPALKIAQVQLGMSIWGSLWNWRFQPGLLLVEGVKLQLVETPTHWIIQGMPLPALPAKVSSHDELLATILENQSIQLKRIKLEVILKNKRTFQLKDLTATLVNRFGSHRLRGEAILSEPATHLNFGAEFVLSPSAPEHLTGHVYIKSDEFVVPDWVNQYIPKGFVLNQAKLGGEIWADISSGKLQGIQTQFNVSQLVWQDEVLNRTGQLSQMVGHVSWVKTQTGFELTGERLSFQDSHGAWPTTAFVLKLDKPSDNYQLFIKNIDITRVLALPLRFPMSMKLLEDLHLTGTLKELYVQQAQNHWSVLTEFDDLGWKGYLKWPEVEHLHGVLHWEQNQGRLALDSPRLRVKINHKPELEFPVFNMSLHWNRDIAGITYSLDHLNASHPHMKLQAHGRVLSSTIPENAWMDVNVRYELMDGSFWLAYLPKVFLKPELYAWLKKDILQLGSAIGQAEIQGYTRDFPFDNGKGKFKIETQLEALNLRYAPHWLQAKGIKGRLVIDKRSLTAQINEALIGGAKLDAVSLRIDDLGLDKEHLLVHGIVNKAPTEDGWSVLLHSPMGHKRALFSVMDWQGTLGLDLQIDAALYPGNDEVLVKGSVRLDNDDLTIKHPHATLKFKKIAGILNFDEQGLLSSELTGTLWEKPIPIKIVSEEKPARNTQIQVTANATVKELFHVFNQSPVAGIDGQLDFTAAMDFPHETSHSEVLTIKSDLQGIKIHYPPYLVKKEDNPVNMVTTVKFNKNQQVSLLTTYADQLQIARSPLGIWEITSSLPYLVGQVKYFPKQSLLSGELTALKIDPGQLDFDSNTNMLNLKPKDLPIVDLVIKSMQYGEWELGRLSLKAHRQGDKWLIDPWKIDDAVYTVTGTADWAQNEDQDTSHLAFNFETKDINKVLQKWHLSPMLESGKAQLQVSLSWEAPLWAGELDDMVGQVNGKVTNGRTAGFSKQTESKLGLVKLLSILSLQTIPRRLLLDFSDLSHDGYSFDEFKGEFKMANGTLQTEKCSIDGPAASTDIYGRIDMVHHVYDLTARVAPQLTASLPIVATIAGGPVAGAATWLASKILNKGVQQITSYAYRITGPWKDPVVEPLKFYRKH